MSRLNRRRRRSLSAPKTVPITRDWLGLFTAIVDGKQLTILCDTYAEARREVNARLRANQHMNTKHQITHKGKLYGYWLNDAGEIVGAVAGEHNIRSESNPHKTPYLREGSKLHAEVLEAIKQQLASRS